jgi:acyl carrier protein phosphodiesterase
VNLLAHALLAERSSASRFGNIIADFLRPSDFERLPPAIQAGIRQHRKVDAYTDRHPVVQRSIARLSRRWGWFSGILIDVYYDHILATDWNRHASNPLAVFVEEVHSAVRDHAALVPDPARGWIERFVEAGRFMSYAIPDGSGIASALEGLSMRIAERMPRRAVRLQDALPDLQSAHEDLLADFREFFPLVQEFASTMHDQTLAAREIPRGLDARSDRSLT